MKYVCKNEECPKYGVEEFYHTESFKFINGRLVGEKCNCPACGLPREEINPNANVPLSEKNISVNLFDGMSQEQKREALRKRAHDDYNKHVKERRDGLMNQAMSEMKNLKQ